MTYRDGNAYAGDRPRLLVVTQQNDLATRTESAVDAETTVEDNPLTAVELLEEFPFDCVVCELDIGPLSGLELLAAVRQRDPTLPVLVVGGDDSDAVSAVIDGKTAEHVLSPADEEAIAEAIRGLLERTVNDEGKASMGMTPDGQAQTQSLERINDATQQCMEATSTSEVATIVLEAAADAFGAELASVWYVNEAGDALQLQEATDTLWQLLGNAGEPPFVHEQGDRVWHAFQNTAPQVLSDIQPEELAADIPVETALIGTLGSHGIVSIARGTARQFTAHERDLIRILARSATVALDRLERERELEQNRDLLARAQRLADVGAWEYDHGSDTIHLTAQTRRICGLPPEGAINLNDGLAVYHPDDRGRIERAVDRALQFGVGFDYRVRIVREESVRRVRVVGEPVIEDDSVVSVRGALLDITSTYRRQRQLERNEQALRDLHDIVVDTDRPFDERIDALLEVGRERVGLSVGYLTNIDDETVELSRIVGDATSLQKGQQLSLAETFCRKVTESQSVVSIYDATKQGLDDDPAYRRFGFDSYIGAPFFVEGELRGTLCFVDSEPRERPFSDLRLAFVRVLVQQVAALFARRHRREQLQALHAATRTLFEADSTDEIPTLVVQSLEQATTLSVTFYRWDEDVGGLVRAASSTDRSARDDGPIRPGDDPVWEGFVRGDEALEPLQVEADETDIHGTDVVVPVGDYGVIVADSPSGNEETPFDMAFLSTLARNVTAALQTAEQNEQLQEYTARLEDQNEHLERLERINAIVRDTLRTLVEAETREEIEHAVCANLTAIEHWELAWIGRQDVSDQSLSVRASSDERARAIASITGHEDGESIAQTAADDGRIVEVSNVLTTDGPEPWRRTVLEQGHQSAIAIPLSFGTREYGVLEIYADRPGAFTSGERSVLAELGTTIAYAIAGIERQQTLQSGAGVELDISIPPAEEFLLHFGTALDQELRVENLIHRTDGGYLAYATASDPQAAAEALAEEPLVDRATAFDTAEHGKIEFGFADSQLLETLSAYDAGLDRLIAGKQANTLTVRLPSTGQVRAFVEHLRAEYPDVTLQAQRTVETETTSLSGVLEDVTDRQREVAAIAYRRGLFQWPRESSGEEIAEAVGISPATFHQHVRAVERQLFEALFGSRESSQMT
ncbi:GAF domain-containing protein [Halapricum desulfuricans]|uniref:Signal transduction regulator n=1 Tax=Halapricum desulfuricans TaxID=2841257 RepID=A0A897N595_9EURY|nr:GAF domain-containing protein [Halapricum desulfuricans]QSG09570.1 Signal transduction regulator [Halapricum desulfuricans]